MFKLNYCNYNRTNNDDDKIHRPDGSGDFLFLLFETPMKIRLGDNVVLTKENAFLLFPKGAPQEYQAIKHFKNSFLHFDADSENFITKYQLPVNEIVYLPNPEMINDIIKQLYVEFSAKDIFYQENSDSLIQQLFITFSRQLQSLPYEQDSDANMFELFQKARVEILTNIEKDWTADSMAALTNLGTSQFYNYYRLFFARSPKSELLDARITRAKYLLCVDRLSVTQAATLSGFRNLSHFTRYFKKSCGMTPVEYAQKLIV